MLAYKRLDAWLTHAVWLIQIEDHDGFTVENLAGYNVFVTKRGADQWLHKKVFEASGVKEL